MSPQIQMIIAGVGIAAWQILVNASGFPAPVANLWVLILSALVAVATATHLAPSGNLGILGGLTTVLFVSIMIVFRHVVPASVTAYLLVAVAGILSGIAVWQFVDVITRVSFSEVGGFLVLMMMAQIATASAYQICTNIYLMGTISPRTLAAFALAIAAGLMLPR